MKTKKELKKVRNILLQEYKDLKLKKITITEANTTRKLMAEIIKSYRVSSLHSLQKDQ